MGIVPFTSFDVKKSNFDSTGNTLIQWVLNAGDVGAPYAAAQYADRNIQVLGTFGGGTLNFQGSNVPTPDQTTDNDWASLHDTQGMAIAETAPGFVEVSEVPWWTRPKLVGGGPVTVLLMIRKTGP